jgi:hypothetical protein
VKTDSSGNKLWDKAFGGTGDDGAAAVRQTSDGGYIFAGYKWSGVGGPPNDAWVVKTDAGGNKQWEKTFGGGDNDNFASVQQTPDGGYIIAGDTWSKGAGCFDFWLVKIDSSGNLQWDRTFGGGRQDRTNSVQQTSDGGYVLAGGFDRSGVST